MWMHFDFGELGEDFWSPHVKRCKRFLRESEELNDNKIEKWLLKMQLQRDLVV